MHEEDNQQSHLRIYSKKSKIMQKIQNARAILPPNKIENKRLEKGKNEILQVCIS